MRSLINRDQGFAREFEEASAEGRDNFRDVVEALWHQKLRESERLLWYACVTYLPQCAWARRGAGQPAVGEPEQVEGRPDYSQLTDEELAQLRGIVAKAVDGRKLRAV
jgi:hypothetical protein